MCAQIESVLAAVRTAQARSAQLLANTDQPHSFRSATAALTCVRSFAFSRPQFDYKSIGVFYSHNISGMPGGITRLLACDEEQLKHYKGLNIGPTLVHKNYARASHHRELGPGEVKAPFGAAARDSSPSYNKPGSIMHWVNEAPEAKKVDYVLYIDADMLLRLVRSTPAPSRECWLSAGALPADAYYVPNPIHSQWTQSRWA